jgi:hypothetical protein
MASGEERVVPVVDGAKDLIRAVAGSEYREGRT